VLKIGDFSRVAHVTVKALRHYGRMGLLYPAWVDRFSGYRYYSIEQLARLNRILALKDLGFSLEQIGELLDHPLSVDELRSILQQKQVELEERLKAEQSRLVQVGLHLEQIEQAGGWNSFEIVLKNVPELCVVGLREIVPDPRLASLRVKYLRRKAVAKVLENGLRLAGTWITISHNREYSERNLDLEVDVVVEPLSNSSALRGRNPWVQRLPAEANMASVVVSDGVRALPQAYGALYTWMEANGWQQTGAVREVCHADPEVDQNCPVIEVQVPIEPPSLSKSLNKKNSVQKESVMEPKFVSKPAFMLVGMKYVGKNKNNEISQMWGRFDPHISQLARTPIQATYGWCGMLKEPPEEGAFEYLAAVEADQAENLPDWAVVRMIPEDTYAAFPHVGPLNTLMNTYHEIYSQWLPQSGYESAAPFDMEVYTDEFRDFAPDSVMYNYLPVKKKA
jgi:predicted transcriptional regulator YdeE/DNA-binding transcriptional MerR regulator